MSAPVKLLWTSGSDSTFRLLQILLIQKRMVQPYYVMDRVRKSFDMEIKSMEKIRRLIFIKDPNARKLLLPTIFKELAEIKPNKVITEKYQRLASLDRLGGQYEWLPRFAEEAKIYDLELSLTSGEHSDSYFKRFLKPSLEKESDGDFFNYKLRENPQNTDLSIFKYFRFPIIEWSKLEMQEIAKENDFFDIMEHTWFCHSPINGSPCGICQPCKIAIKEGMERRIPLSGRVRNFAQFTLKPLLKHKVLIPLRLMPKVDFK
ncbi:MAG TPA: hypothetical protein VD908_21390 [Cytophagales bacterium]|nr:hypothetical protein [Cytophagales bacterium]